MCNPLVLFLLQPSTMPDKELSPLATCLEQIISYQACMCVPFSANHALVAQVIFPMPESVHPLKTVSVSQHSSKRARCHAATSHDLHDSRLYAVSQNQTIYKCTKKTSNSFHYFIYFTHPYPPLYQLLTIHNQLLITTDQSRHGTSTPTITPFTRETGGEQNTKEM